MKGGVVLGIDVGGSKLAGLGLSGDVTIAEVTRPLDGSPIESQVVTLARELMDRSDDIVEAIGVAAPGQVDAIAGVIELAVNLGIRDLHIGRIVAEATGRPCFVEHDARAVAASLAASGPSADVAYLSVGTGISAGIVVGGRLLRGGAGLAGEIGHQLADPAGPTCACGLIGCLEAIASGPAIARAFRDRLDHGEQERVSTTTADVYRAADRGEPRAIAVVERAALHLAAAVRGLVLSLGVTRVVVGGGVAHAGTAFERPLRAAIDRERAASPLVARALTQTAVEVVGDDRHLGARGAAAVARQRLAEDADRSRAAPGEVGAR